ncbi:hypothetical protein HYT92_01140 [Candidatus Pacearchaeota archaeon]|nr:hypothetical protein [Candidatus Pacearchaeota archaeon]
MDIDEFLDRELSDLDLEKEAPEKPRGIGQKEASAAGALTDIRAGLSKSSLEQSEQSYMQLWHSLMLQKLKWDSQMYDQLLSLSRQFSITLSHAHDEARRKISQIRDFLARARSMLKEGNKDAPLKLYAQMQEISSSITDIFFEEKKAVQQEIMNFYRELNSAMDSDLIKKVSSQLQQISQIIDSINMSIRTGNFDKASANYLKCIDAYDQVPEGFLQGKNQAGMRLLEIYKRLSIQAEISSLHKQLGTQPVPSISPIALQASPSVPQKPSKRPVLRAQAATNRERYTLRPVQARPKSIQKNEMPAKDRMLAKKIESAKKNIKKGFYNEAWREVEEALNIDPSNVESKVLAAKIKTLQ